MKNFIIPILTVLTIFQSCASTNNDLMPDETAQKIFTPTELKSIVKMVKFVDSKVSENEKITDINQIYHAYFDRLDSYVLEGKMFPALLKDTAKFKFFETLDKEIFSSIWGIDTALTDLHGFKTLELNYQGKYLKYLKEIGKSDIRYAELYKSIEIAGDISSSTAAWFPAHHQEFDFSSFKDRLWATVFLLRMGDPLKDRQLSTVN